MSPTVNYAISRPRSGRIGGFATAALLHVGLIYGVLQGLSRQIIDVQRPPLSIDILEEKPKPRPEEQPVYHPKLEPVPAYVPPPEVQVRSSEPSSNAISVITNTPPAAPIAPPQVRKPPVIDAEVSCTPPQYPAISHRLEEEGTVRLLFLIGADGNVVQSRVERSSGHSRLDEAAREALAKCQFKPGTVDGKPEQSWARLDYVWSFN